MNPVIRKKVAEIVNGEGHPLVRAKALRALAATVGDGFESAMIIQSASMLEIQHQHASWAMAEEARHRKESSKSSMAAAPAIIAVVIGLAVGGIAAFVKSR